MTSASGSGDEADEGLRELWRSIREHRRYLERSGNLERRRERRLLAELDRVTGAYLSRRVGDLGTAAGAQDVHDALLRREIDPYEAAERLMELGGL